LRSKTVTLGEYKKDVSGASRGAHIDDERERGKAKITPLDTTNFTMCIIALW
jgi:hypothetical protein